MTVRDLIKALLDRPMDSELLLNMGPYEKFVISEIRSSLIDKDEKYTELSFTNMRWGDEETTDRHDSGDDAHRDADTGTDD